MTPKELSDEYVHDHDLRDASQKIYRASTNALARHFGDEVTVETIDRRAVLSWRNQILEDGLSKRSWNTYSSHLRTMYSYAIEHGLMPQITANPFKKTAVQPPKRKSKTVERDAIGKARDWLRYLVEVEQHTRRRTTITPAWFWLTVFEVFYYTGIRLNALLCIRVEDVDLENGLILVCGDTEKTHREYQVPITEGLEPLLQTLLNKAKRAGFKRRDQLFNVNRFSKHYRGEVMNLDQIEGMYKKLTKTTGVRMTPHRFRHTLATDLMKQPDRNIHLTKSLLNHSNLATTMSYIEADYDHMRDVMHERSVAQGALNRVARVDDTGAPKRLQKQTTDDWPVETQGIPGSQPPSHVSFGAGTMAPSFAPLEPSIESATMQFQHNVLFTLMSSQLRALSRREGSERSSRALAARFTT